MKVTVYFGNVRVIVPCGNGDILVRDLMDLAITRYKKATGKSQSSIVTIHNLKSSRDDGILYPDDQLNDVADDREQIIAVFDENYSPIPQFNCGDVTSTSNSVCTGSPDLFSVEVGSHCSIPYNNGEDMDDAHLPGVAPLQVRRGSEPALNCLFPPISSTSDPNKRWSTAVVINAPDNQDHLQDDPHENGVDESVSPLESLDLNGDSKMSSLSFSRSSGRLSILGNNSETHRWVEAADRQLMKDFSESFRMKSPSSDHHEDADSDTSSMSDEGEKTIILKSETGPLGIHVVPDYDSSGRDTGLVIQGIEAGGRIDRDGRFRVGDRITEINGKSLQQVSFQTAQEIFKSALKSSQIKLELIRGSSSHLQSKTAAIPKKPPAPVYPRTILPDNQKKTEEEIPLVEGEERAGGMSTKVATVTPTKKIPASATRRLASANTRRIGKMLTIQLTKGSKGLGFSITTRDNPAGGNSPIYIKNILPNGAAIEDGRLLPGDRLLEVNGTPMTGKSQSDAVSILRNIPLGKTVHLIVSRQEAVEPDPAEIESEPVQQLQPKLDDETGIFPWKYREILTFQIPLTDSNSAGLGVSVKGKTASTSNGPVDLGIFIKSVIPGGAASKDGRLQTNDQLVNINGISLLGMSNTNAMETLRNAMTQSDGPIRNAIILTVARRIFQPPEEGGVPKPEAAPPEKPVNGVDSHLNSIDVTKTLPGCNPVIERLTGLVSVEKDLYGYCRRDKTSLGMEDKFKSNYMSSLNANQVENVIIEGEYDPAQKKVVDVPQRNGVPENPNVAPAGSQLSLDDPNAGFERDGFGRQSMSEKRHAQLDARNTDTYQRNKKAREDRQNSPEQEVIHRNPITGSGSTISHPNSQADEVLGPSLGLRKSSSLESLQTMIQELNKDDEAMKRALKSGNGRGSRNRGCNESFRAAVDRSYDAPSASTMDTLDEESESGSSVGHLLTRSTEFPDANQNLDMLHDDPLTRRFTLMTCDSKASKKKGLLKGLGSVFKFGKHRKHSHDLKSKTDEDSGHEEYYHHQHSSSKDSDSLMEMSREDLLKRQLPQIPRESVSSLESIPSNRQERMQSLREQHQRMHQKRQGQYPLEQKEEYYENELKEKEGNYALPFEIVHGRSHSLDTHIESSHHHSKGPATLGDPNRYSHYMNYKEIQQHITHRGHPPAVATSSLPEPKTHHKAPLPELPITNFYDYTGHLRKTGQNTEVCSNSLPRGSRGSDHSLPRVHAPPGKPYHFQDEHDNYGRMNVHHFYPNNNNNKLYSHIVPGSKV